MQNVTDSGITGEQNGFSICRLARLERVVISLNGKSEISDLSLEHFSRLQNLQILWLSLRVQVSLKSSHFKFITRIGYFGQRDGLERISSDGYSNFHFKL